MEPGDLIPDVAATLHDGSTVPLSALVEHGPVVLFFYPKAFSGGCTAEARHFRDLGAEFAELGARPIGVSRDDPDTQARFEQANELGYPLISDPRGELATLFGAKRLGPLPPKRRTAVVAPDRTLLGVVSSETDMRIHADEALRLLREHASGD